MLYRRVYFLVFLYSIFSCCHANDRVGMTAIDFLNIPQLSSPSLSPDGSRLIYRQQTSDWEANKQLANLWLVELASGKTYQLTYDDNEEEKASWSPDGKYISFLAKRKADKFERLYLLPLSGGEAFSIIDHNADIEQYYWNKDGGSIYYLADIPLANEIADRVDNKDDMVPFEQPLSFRHIWRYDLNKKTITQITRGKFHVLDFDLSRDSKLIAFKKSRGLTRTLDDANFADIWVVQSNGKKSRRISNNEFNEKEIQISPDGKSVLFFADVNAKGEYYYDANLFTVDIKNKKVNALAIEQKFEVEAAAWSKQGKHIYIRANMGVRSEIWSIDVDSGESSQLTDGRHVVRDWHYDPKNDKHVFMLNTASDPGDAWQMGGDGGHLTKITRVHEDLTKRFKLPKQELITWTGHDGVKLEGMLSLPLNYVKGKRYPLVTHSHGGPKSSYQWGQFRWRTYIPVLTALGYAYFSPNYRGGRGYGDEFMRDMVGSYFNNAHLDVLSGIDHLIEQGIADPGRLVAAGWSAGGHMTNKLITFTDRFKAASSGAGAVDWISMYGETDVRYGRTTWFGGTPWQKNAPIDVYIKNSPLKDMWKVKTPTLIFVGEKDLRVPPTQSMLMYRALRDLGVETKLYIAPREKHAFEELRHRLFKINAELEWYERHVRGRDYEWQRFN